LDIGTQRQAEGRRMTHSALLFLRHLDPSPIENFNIEAFTDVPKGATKPKPDRLCRRYANLSLDEVKALIPELETLNRAGAAIYFTVNQCDGQRSKANIVRVRGVHADLDDVSEKILSSIREILKPTLEVQSSGPTNFHFYWLLASGEEMSVDLAEATNRGLTELGADPAATDVSRLLRLPGFRHMKYCGGGRNDEVIDCPIVTLRSIGTRYTTAQIEAALPKAVNRCRAKGRLSFFKGVDDTPRQRARVADALAHISANCSYELYRDMVWAILSLGWHDSEQIAEAWCLTAPDRFEEDNFWIVANSYDETRTPTMGTIIHQARAGGWNG
jgi:hypothetical protein